MLSYSLKRLLLSLPVLWFLITLVFLLSKLLPGTYGSESMHYGEGATYNKSSQQQRDQVYQDYLRKTGQDLPVFYFSLGTRANSSHQQSDVLYSGKLVEQLSWRFGNPHKALAYDKALKELERKVREDQLNEHLPAVFSLQTVSDPDTILQTLSSLSTALPTGRAKSTATDLLQIATKLIGERSELAFLIPNFQWHGIHNQYHLWFLSLLTGDLGVSLRDARPVAANLLEAVSNTFWLLLSSMLLSFVLALELGISLVKKSRVNLRRMLMPALYILDSLPLFVLSLILLLFFASPDFLPIFPVFGLGYHSYTADSWYSQITDTAPYLVLPTLCLVLANLPYLTNQVFRALADTMQANFIKTARSKGLKEGAIIRKHALRNALFPVITVISDYLPALVAGAVVIETIFAIPGIGRLLITSVLARDFPVVIGIVLMVALVKMLSHLVADLCYAQADPRVRKATTA